MKSRKVLGNVIFLLAILVLSASLAEAPAPTVTYVSGYGGTGSTAIGDFNAELGPQGLEDATELGYKYGSDLGNLEIYFNDNATNEYLVHYKVLSTRNR